MRKKIILTIWLIAGVVVHILMEMGARRVGNGEPYISELVYMTILTFPIGIVVPLLWTGILGVFSGTHPGSILESNTIMTNLLIWITYIGLGYFQWFTLLPRIVEKIKKRQDSKQI